VAVAVSVPLGLEGGEGAGEVAWVQERVLGDVVAEGVQLVPSGENETEEGG